MPVLQIRSPGIRVETCWLGQIQVVSLSGEDLAATCLLAMTATANPSTTIEAHAETCWQVWIRRQTPGKVGYHGETYSLASKRKEKGRLHAVPALGETYLVMTMNLKKWKRRVRRGAAQEVLQEEILARETGAVV